MVDSGWSKRSASTTHYRLSTIHYLPSAPMPRRVFITAAEVSGDQHAAELIRSLKQLDPEIIIEGFGGPLMAAAGANILHETTRKAAMTFYAVARVFEVSKLLKQAREYYLK